MVCRSSGLCEYRHPLKILRYPEVIMGMVFFVFFLFVCVCVCV